MCGIVGIWRRTGTVAERDIGELKQMSAALTHRGPDGDGDWSSDKLALAHRRLTVIDPSNRGQQPMVTRDGMGVISYNGEVYNFGALRRELELEGVDFLSRTDSEVVLYALHRWGVEQAVKKFNGMFAFAYYDMRTGDLWLARDRSGVKGLSVMVTNDRVLFASEDKGLLAAGSVNAQVDARSVTQFLAMQYIDSYRSYFTGIERLPPAGLWRINGKQIEKKTFWHALDTVDVDHLNNCPNDIDAEIAKLEGLVQGSVAMHAISDVAIATTCSSGVDSGLLTALLRNHVKQYHSYVISPDEGENEYNEALQTAQMSGIELRAVPVTRESYLRGLPKTIFDLESGITSFAPVAKNILTSRCKADGIKVLLTGEGSDEIFGGYDWHKISANRHRFTGHPLIKLLLPKSAFRRHQRLLNAPFVNSPGFGDVNQSQISTSSLFPRHNLFSNQVMTALAQVKSPFGRVYAGSGMFDFYFHMQDIVHRHDRISMANSVEMRVPFLENNLIDFALNLHPSLKWRHRQGKWLLKKVAEKHIPKTNIYAKKRGFPVTGSYLKGSEKLLAGGLLGDLMGWSRTEEEGVVALAAERSAIGLRLVSMEILLRVYQDGQSTEDLGETLLGM